MDEKKVLPKDPFILLSWINMKLRDEFSSIYILCEEYEVSNEDIVKRLGQIGYEYSEKANQFISSEV